MAEDKGKLLIRLESSQSSPAGAAAAYLLRRIAARAGSYAPGIQEHLFYELGQRSNGFSLEQVARWIQANSQTFSALGYYFLTRIVSSPSKTVVAWVEEGTGYRAAVLEADGSKLHEDSSMPSDHAVGITVHDATSGIADDTLASGLLMVDAWPGRVKFSALPDTLDIAHRVYKYRSLLIFWAGHG